MVVWNRTITMLWFRASVLFSLISLVSQNREMIEKSSSGDLHSKLRLGVWHSNPASIDKGLFQKQWQWQMTEWS